MVSESLEENPLRRGLDARSAARPYAIVIFGVTGDLARRKLIPALYRLFKLGLAADPYIVGFARRDWDDGRLRREASAAIAAGDSEEEETRATFLSRISYLRSSFDEAEGYRELARRLPHGRPIVYYLSTPPDKYRDIIEQLGRHELLDTQEGPEARVVVEKPFGRDLASARELNITARRYLRESQLYRIDHYLGKETVQNLLVLRFANSIFEPIWNNHYVDHVQITVAEQVGVEGRGGYFDRAGSTRDMIQNHVLQLASLIAMEPPTDLSPDAVRSEKAKVMRAVHPLRGNDARDNVVLGQYAAGVLGGEHVPGYREEDRVSPDSRTDTFAAVRLELAGWRWAGVPFYLRTGKRMPRKVSEIAVSFKQPPHNLFPGIPELQDVGNSLVIHIQPREGATLTVRSKIPGFSNATRPVSLDFSYGTSFAESSPEAYERLLLDAIVGDSTLYTRDDEIEHAWELVDAILEAFSDQEPARYEAGTAGPREAYELLRRHGRRWRRL